MIWYMEFCFRPHHSYSTYAVKLCENVGYTNMTKLQSVLHINPITSNVFWSNCNQKCMCRKYVNNEIDLKHNEINDLTQHWCYYYIRQWLPYV